jgi:carbonic anhydrase
MSHTCRALVVTCMDFRFQSSFRDFLVEQGLENDYDLYSIAGTQKTFIDEETRAIALKQVELSIKLHGMTDVYLIAHWDCGAYGGNAALGGGEAETQKYEEDLERARVIINEKFPEVNVHKYLAMKDNEKVEFVKK